VNKPVGFNRRVGRFLTVVAKATATRNVREYKVPGGAPLSKEEKRVRYPAAGNGESGGLLTISVTRIVGRVTRFLSGIYIGIGGACEGVRNNKNQRRPFDPAEQPCVSGVGWGCVPIRITHGL